MIFKKNWFTNFIWIAASVIIGLNILCYVKFVPELLPFTKTILVKRGKMPGAIQAGVAVGLMVLLVDVYFGIHAAVKAVSKRLSPVLEDKKKLRSIAELIVFFLVIAGAIAARVVMIGANPYPVIEDTYYFDMALVKMDESLLALDHNASYFYVVLLSFFMRFLGNKVIAAVILQFILQILSLAFMYFGLRKVTGFWPAFVCSAVFAWNPSYMHLMYVVDAQCFMTLLFSVSFYFIGRIYQVFYRESGSVNLVLSIVFAGLFSGLCCFLEPYGLLLFLFVLMLCFRDSDWFEPGVKAFLAVGFFISAAAVLAFLFTFESMKDNVDIINPIRSWLTFLQEVDPIHFAFFDPAYAADTKRIGFALVCGAFLLFPGYLMRKRIKFIALAMLLVLAPVPFGNMGYLHYQEIAPWAWSLLAGYGLQMMLTVSDSAWKVTEEASEAEQESEPEPIPVTAPKAKQRQKLVSKPKQNPEQTAKPEPVAEPKIEQKPAAESEWEPVVESEEPEPIEEVKPVAEPEPVVEELEPVAEPELIAKEPEAVEEPEFIAEEPEPIEEPEPVVAPEPRRKVEPIPNPLPVPKKHVKKKADFALSLDEDEDELEFDIDISDDDDFDI